MKLTVRLNPADNVVNAIVSLNAGTDCEGISTNQNIPRGHKMATQTIRMGDPVLKYAQVIGYASEDIAAGDHVHTHNLEFRNVDQKYEFSTDLRPIEPATTLDTFMGYKRENGKVGTRKLYRCNYIG